MSLPSTLGPLGAWVARGLPVAERVRIARAAEELGWGAVWMSGGIARGALDDIRPLLEATSTITLGTSILNMWAETPAEATAQFVAIDRDFPGRLLLGVGPSHAPLVATLDNVTYTPPLRTIQNYLAGLEAEASPVPRDRLLLSALGPRALAVAAERTAGTIPYLTVPAHTAAARAAVGPDRLVAPELGVVLTDDLAAGRAAARAFVAPYLTLPNYTSTMLRHGVEPADLENGGSDRLIDLLFGIGPIERVHAAIAAHRDAGADHVAVQVIALPDQDRVAVLHAIAEHSA